MTEANRRRNARSEAGLGDDALQAAAALLQLGLHNDAASRAYYAAFHYARALLLTEGLEPRTHRGLGSLLGERFGVTGRLRPEALAILARLQTYRMAADYEAAERLSIERASLEVADAHAFVDEALAVLKAGGWLD
ncbi:MAG: HEPN domain-containing protein [Deltaproteobacteria bacterium]|nr:HEPN domain-containing protein [Deltaproteobacteria bacterium]